MEVTTLGNIITSTLFTMGRPVGGKDYVWMKQQAIEFIKFRLPQNGCLFTNVDYVKLSPSNKVYTLPSGAVSVTKIGYLQGNRVYSLTVDNTLALPNNEEFMCDGYPNTNIVEGFFPNFLESFNAPSYSSATGGRNVNYYRKNGRQIIFSNEIPNGKLVIEYIGIGDVSEGTIIEPAYVRMLKLWLIREYNVHKGDKSMVAFNSAEYEAESYNANTLLYSPELREITDAIRRATHFSLG
jgi:hypothetical protein